MICVVDYGMGNLRSVSKALGAVGGRVCVTSNPKQVAKASKIVLPGVGEFGHAIQELKRRQLLKPLQNVIQNRKPFLGICLGLQLLFEKSEESPRVRGLSVIRGSVNRLKSTVNHPIKIPQMGWNQVKLTRKSPLMRGV